MEWRIGPASIRAASVTHRGPTLGYRVEADGSSLFTEDILTQPGAKRIALECPVRSLHAILNNLASHGAKIEHIYDY